MIDDNLYVVQLMHPGPEHKPNLGNAKTWNRLRSSQRKPNRHKRSFLQSRGVYLSNGSPVEADVVFWAEWEPEAQVLRHFLTPADGYPRYIFQPYYRKPTRYVGLHNTDPFVFGGFYYTFCHQKGDSRIKHMNAGSVILFGSHHQGQFLIDTVLVVKNFQDHNRASWRGELGLHVSEAYRDVTLEPGYANGGTSYRLYFGATYTDLYQGMYSFFPCLPADQQPEGFPRPRIELPGIISNKLKMNFKMNCLSTTGEARNTWEAVKQQVVQQGLVIGIGAEAPRRVE